LGTHIQTKHNKPASEALALAMGVKAAEMSKIASSESAHGNLYLGILDLETTGLIKRDRPLPKIVDIAVRIVRSDTTLFSLVNPLEPIPQSASQIHGITDDKVITAPSFKDVALTITKKVSEIVSSQDAIVFLAHNGDKFDGPILRAAFKDCEVPIPPNWHICDSLTLFKGMLPKQTGTWKPWALGNLHQRLVGRPIVDQHRAVGDVLALERCLRAVFTSNHQGGVVFEGAVLDAVRACNPDMFT
jgi:DNA polymerase III epsilon subunit-like protein